MSERDVRAFLFDGVAAIDRATKYMLGLSRESFVQTSLIRDAVERQIITLGEAMSNLRQYFPDMAGKVPGLPQIVGMRNVLVHAYRSSDSELIWVTVTTRLVPLRSHLQALLVEADGPSES